jgi:hypothetical protein
MLANCLPAGGIGDDAGLSRCANAAMIAVLGQSGACRWWEAPLIGELVAVKRLIIGGLGAWIIAALFAALTVGGASAATKKTEMSACNSLTAEASCRARSDCTWVSASIDQQTKKQKRRAYCRSKPKSSGKKATKKSTKKKATEKEGTEKKVGEKKATKKKTKKKASEKEGTEKKSGEKTKKTKKTKAKKKKDTEK